MPNTDLNGVATKLKELLDAKRASPNSAYSAAFYVGGELQAAICGGTIDGAEGSAPVTNSALFNIGSVSKVYCALSVMKLVELGLAELDEPVCTYLPRFTMRDERYRKITLRMCINHSSGLPGTFMEGLFGSQWLGDGLYDRVYKYLERSVLKAEPGSYSVYCNDGFTLAEMVITERSGLRYIDFLKKYITGPAGATSVCVGAEALNEHHVRETGREHEVLSLAGSGGVISTISDCALVGSLFIDGKGALGKESIDAIAAPQGLTYLTDEVAGSFGYGWDSVRFEHPVYDFGPGALMKSGGTLQFSTYLLVFPALGLSAAMSATMSNGIDVLAELCELCAVLMKELGQELKTKPQGEAPGEVPLPEGFAEAHAGIYHNFMGTYEASFAEGKLFLKTYAAGAMQDMIPGAVYDGQWFNFGPLSLGFQQHDGRIYLMQKGLIGTTALAETVPWKEPVPAEWAARIGKRYIAHGFDPFDSSIGCMYAGLCIERLAGEELLLFCTKAPFLPYGTLPVAFSGGEAKMPLTAPGGAGSRDQFTPQVFEEDGVEYIYDRGYTYKDVAALPALPCGTLAVKAGTQSYSLPEGKPLQLTGAKQARAIVLAGDMSVLYNGPTGAALPDGGSFLLLACGEDMELTVAEAAQDD